MEKKNSGTFESEKKLNIPVYIISILFGISVLLPISSLLTSLDFFIFKFEDRNPAFVLPLALNAPMFTFIFIGFFIEEYISLLHRTLLGYFGLTACLIWIPIFIHSLEADISWILTLWAIGLMGVFASFIENGVCGFVAILPNQYVSAIMVGMGISGLMFNFIRIICIIALPPEENNADDKNLYYGCLIFFATSILFWLICSAASIYAFHTDFARYYIEKSHHSTQNAPLIKSNENEDNFDSNLNSNLNFTNERLQHSQSSDIKQIYDKIWLCALQMSLWFITTFVIYPGVAQSTNLGFLSNSDSQITWLVITITTTFGISDLAGRYAAELFPRFNSKNIVFLAVLRLLFIPIFIIISKAGAPTWLFGSDIFKISNLALFSFTNGYHCTRLMVIGTKAVNLDLQEKAGMIMNWHWIGGIFAGSLIATLVMSRYF